MSRRAAGLIAVLFAAGLGLGTLYYMTSRVPDTVDFLPSATSDALYADIGVLAESSLENTFTLIETRAVPETYPAGTKAVLFEVTNRGSLPISYTGYFDFREMKNGKWNPLPVRSDVHFDQTERLLQAGETVLLTIPIDLFETPLPAGIYRAAQLVCFDGEDGVCNEITAAFMIE